jgi:hypothetical protein
MSFRNEKENYWILIKERELLVDTDKKRFILVWVPLDEESLIIIIFVSKHQLKRRLSSVHIFFPN